MSPRAASVIPTIRVMRALPGDVQWMIAGRGLIHNEIPAEGVNVHSLQLWVNLPAADKMTGARF